MKKSKLKYIFAASLLLLINNTKSTEGDHALIHQKFIQSLQTSAIDKNKSMRAEITSAKSYQSSREGYQAVVDLRVKRGQSLDGGFVNISKIFYSQTISIWFESLYHADKFVQLINSDKEMIILYNKTHASEFRNQLEIPGRLLFSFDPKNKTITPIFNL